MYLFLILLLISFIGIIIMIGKKIVLLRNGRLLEVNEEISINTDYLKKTSLKHSKRISYILLFVILRTYIRSSNFLKTKSKLLWTETKKLMKKKRSKITNDIQKEKEVSKYLKTISEYRKKINKMKDRIKEEEGIE